MRASVLLVLNGDIELGSALPAVHCVRAGIISCVAPIRGKNLVTRLGVTQLLWWICHHSLLWQSRCHVVVFLRVEGLLHLVVVLVIESR